MKIGDKVRFLNDVGGGVISGFQDKDMVLVRTDDGFELPTLAKDVIAVETDDYNLSKKPAAPGPAATEADAPAFTSIKQSLTADTDEPEEETDIADSELTYRPSVSERRGGEKANLSLAFVPQDIKRLSQTDFEVWLVNDCNYYFRYLVFGREGEDGRMLAEGELAPNTKFRLQTLRPAELDAWEYLCVQAMAYKRDKAFAPKAPYHIGLRIALPRLVKLHTYGQSDFFDTPAWVTELVKDDQAVRGLHVETALLQDTMQNAAPAAQPARHTAAGPAARSARDPRAPMEVDLHAEQLLDTLNGLQPKDILEYQLKVFRETLDARLKQRGLRIVFIHGKGDGVLRNAILRELRTRYRQCRWQDASFSEYGYGATMVTI